MRLERSRAAAFSAFVFSIDFNSVFTFAIAPPSLPFVLILCYARAPLVGIHPSVANGGLPGNLHTPPLEEPHVKRDKNSIFWRGHLVFPSLFTSLDLPFFPRFNASLLWIRRGDSDMKRPQVLQGCLRPTTSQVRQTEGVHRNPEPQVRWAPTPHG